MALSEDQKAMLRLLAQREQGYDDIAALTGSSVEEVRAKVKGAIAGLDGTLSGDQRAMLRLLAQREEGYADIAALTGSSVGEVRAKVKDALGGLEDGAPEEKPAAPEKAPEPPPPTAAGPAAKRAAPGGLKLPEDRGVRRALAAGGAVVLVIVLLLVTGVLGDDEGGSSDATTTTTGDESALNAEGGATTAGGKEATQALLKAVDGSDATGQALFGRSGQKVVLLLGAKGLQPAPAGQSYTVSLVRSENQRLPLVATTATKSGIISGRFQVAPQVLGLLAGGFDEMELSLVPNDELRAALAQARTAKKAPNYGGTTVLRGPVTGPIVEAGEEG